MKKRSELTKETQTAEHLQKCLTYLKQGLASSDLIEQASRIIFSSDHVRTFNNEVAVQCDFQSGITGAVQAKEFLGFMSHLPANTGILLEMSKQEDQASLLIKTRRGKTCFLLEKLGMIAKEIPTPKIWHKLPVRFLEKLKLTQIAVGTSSSYPILTAIQWNEHGLWSCDNFRIMHCVMKSEPLIGHSILIPAASVKSLPDSTDHFSVSPGWVHFRSQVEGVTQSCRLMTGKYPDLSKMILVEKANHVQLPMKLCAALERASVFTGVKSGSETQFTAQDGLLVMSTKFLGGWSRERFKIPTKMSFSFSLDPMILWDALQLSDTIIVGKQSLMIQGKRFTHVIALQ